MGRGLAADSHSPPESLSERSAAGGISIRVRDGAPLRRSNPPLRFPNLSGKRIVLLRFSQRQGRRMRLSLRVSNLLTRPVAKIVWRSVISPLGVDLTGGFETP